MKIELQNITKMKGIEIGTNSSRSLLGDKYIYIQLGNIFFVIVLYVIHTIVKVYYTRS